MAETPIHHHDMTKKTFTKASYSASFENQKGFLAERQKVQPFLKTGSLTTKSPIRKRKKNLNAKRLHLFQHFMIFSLRWFCSLTNLQVLEERLPKKRKKEKKQKSQFVPICRAPKTSTESTERHESTFTTTKKNRNPNHRAPKPLAETHKGNTGNTKKNASVSKMCFSRNPCR